MHLFGLPLTTLVAAGSAAGAAIVALYWLRVRKRPVAVAWIGLFESVVREREATALFSQLRRLFSLLVQLALVALLVAALGDPRPEARAPSSRTFALLVDVSASMQAKDATTTLGPERTRLEAARERAHALARALGPGDRMLVAAMGATPEALGTMTGDVADLDRAIDRVRATEAPADVDRALAFAADALAGAPGPEIVVVSDGAFAARRGHEADLRGAKLSFVHLGSRSRNVGITALTVRRYPLDRDRYEAMLEIVNADAAPHDVELTLVGDGQVIDVSTVRVEAGAVVPRFYTSLSGVERTLEARVALEGGARDDLAADDSAYATLPDRRRVRVLAVTRGDAYLEAALLLPSYLDVSYLDPDLYPPAEGSSLGDASFDVTIFDRVAPRPAAGAGNVLYFAPSGRDAPLEVGRAELRDVGFDRVDAKSALVRGTSIEDVFVTRAHALVPSAGDRVIGACDSGALLVEGRRGGARFVALGFDPRESDLVLRAAFPLFVLAAIGELTSEDTRYLASFSTGETFRVPIPEGAAAAEARVVDPLGESHVVPVVEGRAVFRGTHVGFHELVVGEGATPAHSTFAANLASRDESTIAPRPFATKDGAPAVAPAGLSPGTRRELWAVLVGVAVLVLALEWVTYHRRITV